MPKAIWARRRTWSEQRRTKWWRTRRAQCSRCAGRDTPRTGFVRRRESDCGEALESGAIRDYQSRTLKSNKTPFSEVAQGASDRLAGAADEFGDLLMSQRKMALGAVLGLLRPRGPFEEQAGQLCGGGCRKANRSELLASAVIV